MSASSSLAQALASGALEIIDLTAPLSPSTPVVQVPPPFAPSAALSVTPISDFDENGPGWSWNDVTLGEHSGTHVDAPRHWISGREGKGIDEIEPSRLVGPVAVIDKTAEVEADRTFLLQPEHLTRWQEAHGTFAPGTWLILRTGWSKHADNPDEFATAAGWPGLSLAAAKMIAADPNISGYGVEAIGIDSMGSGPSADGTSGEDPDPGAFGPGHYYILGADKYGLTYLRNVDRLPVTGATIVVAPIPLVGGTGAPARVFAFVERG
ncbi:cyclase family protein [Agromyces bauzanensis]